MDLNELISAFKVPQINVVLCFIIAAFRGADESPSELTQALSTNKNEFLESGKKLSDESLSVTFFLTYTLINAADSQGRFIYDLALPELEYDNLLTVGDQGTQSLKSRLEEGDIEKNDLIVFIQEIERLLALMIDSEALREYKVFRITAALKMFRQLIEET